MPVPDLRYALGWLLALLSVVMSAGSSARAAEGDFCGFLQKVLASKPQEFAPFRGRSKGNTLFDATLAPSPEFRCSIVVRRKFGDKILPPAYKCLDMAKGPFEGLVGRYTQMADATKTCLPGWRFEEEKKGDAAARDQTWTLEASNADGEVSLSMFNWSILKTSDPVVVIEVSIIDLAPAAADAEIPVMK